MFSQFSYDNIFRNVYVNDVHKRRLEILTISASAKIPNKSISCNSLFNDNTIV
jgi:hypothetical protein